MTLHVCFSKAIQDKTIAFNLDINSSGVTAVFGPSGAGKTTLLRVIAGLDKHLGAKVKFNQQVWQNENVFIPPEHRHIGMVFQQPSLFEHLNVEQNIYFSAGLKANKNRRKRFDMLQFIELLQLTPLLKRAPSTLSGGEQQRVAIVRALATQPDLLLMDEPLSALDEVLKSQFLDYLEDLLTQISIPVVYVTHSKEELARVSNQVVLLNENGVLGQGSSDELLTDLKLPLTLGSDLQCVLDAQVKSIDQQQHVSVLNTSVGELSVNVINKQVDDTLKVVIHGKDVSVALSHAKDTSILNVLHGYIDDFKFIENGSVVLKLKVGNGVMLSQITQKSFHQLGLAKSLPVFAQIKGVVLK